jgi:hypothetical protein
MEAYQWFLLGMMAGFIPSFVVLALVMKRACRCTGRMRHRDRADDDHP